MGKPLILIVIFLGLSSIAGYSVPLATSNLFEKLNIQSNEFHWAMALLFFVGLGEYIIRAGYQLSLNIYLLKIIQKARKDCFEHWLNSYEVKREGKKSKEFPLGEVLARIVNDTEALRDLVHSGAFTIIIDAIFIISCFISFVSLNALTGGVLFFVEVLVCLALIWGGKFMAQAYLKVREANGHMARVTANITGGLDQAYFTPTHHYSSQKGEKVFNHFLQMQLRANVWDSSYYSLAESLLPIFLVVLVVIAPFSNLASVAIVAVLIDLIQRSINPIKGIAGKISNIQRAYSGILRIREFREGLINEGEDQQSNSKAEKKLYDAIKTLKVSIPTFSYNTDSEEKNSFSLSNIKFAAEKGELIGIVGQSGCGKSTLLNILAGNIIPKNGGVKLEFSSDGAVEFPGNSFSDIIHYRHYIGLVAQDSHIFSASLAFNLCLELQQEESTNLIKFYGEIKNKIPYLKKWGIELTDKLEIDQLSLGQKQLISALRSCYLKRPIICFDEVSSGLDSALEEALRILVLELQKYSLTFIVAHRIETLVGAQKILVMEDGKIKEQGNHQSLLQDSPIYQQFVSKLLSE